MTSHQTALRAIRTQVQFELAQTAAEVARAASVSAEAQREVTILMQHCESATRELRDAMGRSRINPALLDAMRRIYQVEQRALCDWEVRLEAARQREAQARAALAGVRNRERSLERAQQVERRRRQLKEQAIEIIRADDMWLQRVWRERS
jgi:predicted GTPase